MPWILKVSSSFLWFPHRCTAILHKNPHLSCFSYCCVFQCQHSPDLVLRAWMCALLVVDTIFFSACWFFVAHFTLSTVSVCFNFKVLAREFRQLVWVCICWRNVYTCYILASDWSKSALQTMLFDLSLHALASIVSSFAIFYLSCHCKCWIFNTNMRKWVISLMLSDKWMKWFDLV
jgi:hypothetical protein